MDGPERRPIENLASIVGRLAFMIDERLSPSDVATLRRMRPDDIAAPVFWRIAASELADALAGDGDRRDEQERRWASILQAMAELRGMHDPHSSLGAALVRADVSEQRALKLLRASGDALLDAVRVIAHHLATKGVPVNATDLARLVLSDGRVDEEAVRRRIARDYYAALEKKEAEIRP
jgi:CRISPR type I-E-associated protein CasB/Cse2